MKKSYKVWDIENGLLSVDVVVSANSPAEAVKQLYNDVKRVMYGGHIVVHGATGSYLFDGVKKER